MVHFSSEETLQNAKRKERSLEDLLIEKRRRNWQTFVVIFGLLKVVAINIMNDLNTSFLDENDGNVRVREV